MEDLVSSFLTNLFLRKPLKYEHNQLSNGPGSLVPCGSDSEFYIVPPLPCISDSDVLVCLTNDVAFTENNMVLPHDLRCFDEMIECVRVVPYENYPGFVKLVVVGNLIYSWNFEKYIFRKVIKQKSISGRIVRQDIKKEVSDLCQAQNVTFKGPALTKKVKHRIHDDVYCICCPKWPKEAKDWPTRKRNGEWPLPAMVLEVVRNGCHIVCAQHRDCRDDEFQFRFSFSLAEVILLRSWTPNQQLIYHMLRCFAKKELIKEDCPKEKEVLCNYHLKMLMLWTCEQESAEWWNSLSVVAICCKLLRKLLQWIEKRHCPNYFIPEANLFSGKVDPVTVKSIRDKLEIYRDVAKLSQWFVENYLLQCHKNLIEDLIGEFNISRLYNTFLRSKRQEQLQLLDDNFTSLSCAYMTGVWEFSEIAIGNEIKAYAHINKELSIFSRRNFVLRSEAPLIYLDSTLLMLFASSLLTCRRVLNCNEFVSDALSVVSLGTAASADWRRYHNFPKTYGDRLKTSHICFLIAQEHMGKLVSPGNNPEFQLMSRLSMEYLRKSYSTKDAPSSAIQIVTLVYMAAICFATSQFQVTVDLCSKIFQNAQYHTLQRKIEFLNAGCLIFIDGVSNCIGFVALFQYIINKLRPDYRQNTFNLRLTPQVFAEYLMIQSAERMSKQVRMYWNEVPAVSLIDCLFMKVVKRKLPNKSIVRCGSRLCVYRQHDEVEEVLDRVTGFSLNEDISNQLLMECSLESIASLYQEISHHYGVQCHTVVNCYRALYFFKLCQYDKVLSLCDQILNDPKLENYLTKLSRPQTIYRNQCPNWFAFPHVLALRPFSVYFDEDIQCLLGFQVLCHVTVPERADSTAHKITFDARIGERHGSRNQIDMSYHHILTRKSYMLQYFLGRHFLARYLKLRCFLLCDQRPVSEILEVFGELRALLPLEHVIYEFLLRKLQTNFPD